VIIYDIEVWRAFNVAFPKSTTVLGLAETLHEQVAREIELLFIAAVYGDVKDNEEGVLVIGQKKK